MKYISKRLGLYFTLGVGEAANVVVCCAILFLTLLAQLSYTHAHTLSPTWNTTSQIQSKAAPKIYIFFISGYPSIYLPLHAFRYLPPTHFFQSIFFSSFLCFSPQNPESSIFFICIVYLFIYFFVYRQLLQRLLVVQFLCLSSDYCILIIIFLFCFLFTPFTANWSKAIPYIPIKHINFKNDKWTTPTLITFLLFYFSGVLLACQYILFYYLSLLASLLFMPCSEPLIIWYLVVCLFSWEEDILSLFFFFLFPFLLSSFVDNIVDISYLMQWMTLPAPTYCVLAISIACNWPKSLWAMWDRQLLSH